MPERNRRWRKSHQNKNLTAPYSKECEICENKSCADRELADRQLIVGIQIRQLECVHASAAILQKASVICRTTDCAAFGSPNAAHFVLTAKSPQHPKFRRAFQIPAKTHHSDVVPCCFERRINGADSIQGMNDERRFFVVSLQPLPD